MSFRKEPPYTHGSIAHSAVVLVNLGTPDAPTAGAVRRYLKQFLSDPRVVEILQVGAKIRSDLDQGRFTAEGAYGQAGNAAARLSGRTRA
jgi:hypothetical protein